MSVAGSSWWGPLVRAGSMNEHRTSSSSGGSQLEKAKVRFVTATVYCGTQGLPCAFITPIFCSFFFLFYFWTLPFPFFRRTSGELGFGSASGSGHSLPPAARILWSSLPPSLLDPRAVRGEFAPAPVSTCRVRVRLAVIGSEDGEIPVLGNGLDSLRWGGPSIWLVSWIGLIKEFFFSLGGGGGLGGGRKWCVEY